MPRRAALVAAVLLVVLAPPALAQRRLDARKRARELLASLAGAGELQAGRLEEELAALATDLDYMDAVEPVLIEGLAAADVASRRAAARVLRYTISGAAVSPLARALAGDQVEDVRMEAVTSLCILKADEVVGTLRAAGTSDRSARVRAAAVAALDVIEDREGGRAAGCRRALQRRLAALR
jgi:HEAT repeat protein